MTLGVTFGSGLWDGSVSTRGVGVGMLEDGCDENGEPFGVKSGRFSMTGG